MSKIDLPEHMDIFGQNISLSPVQQSLSPLENATEGIVRTISGLPPLKLPISGERTKSWLITTYLDKDLRISRGDGGLFVLVKEESSLLDHHYSQRNNLKIGKLRAFAYNMMLFEVLVLFVSSHQCVKPAQIIDMKHEDSQFTLGHEGEGMKIRQYIQSRLRRCGTVKTDNMEGLSSVSLSEVGVGEKES
ncbi:hypothetical protein RND71_004830 [Anisodus tanguticus]|uniref:Plastid lipid-associated protein/fibrillin conserved domain-containing protein n=1 Tax=Anisodus tanguticus TaxID=243964 RepID=A0AAE1VKY4_9SOLA|nr:hypothetical protein RND71_004830 [Anisodus tanguticus]